MTENFLEHFGVKGMKWGIRKDRKSGRGKGGTKPGKSLTDTELKKRINRLNMEKQYSDLSKRQTSSIEKGSKVVAGVIGSIGQQAITKAVQAEADDQASKLLTKVINRLEDYG